MKYRIMVLGEDGMEFCIKNNVEDFEVDDLVEETEEDYPEGRVFVEEESTNF